jgi:hypothetical protein
MNNFSYLEEHRYVKHSHGSYDYHIYYYEDQEETFQARIIVPKNEKRTFSFVYYKKEKSYYALEKEEHNIPAWFLEIAKRAENQVEKRDRLMRILN